MAKPQQISSCTESGASRTTDSNSGIALMELVLSIICEPDIEAYSGNSRCKPLCVMKLFESGIPPFLADVNHTQIGMCRDRARIQFYYGPKCLLGLIQSPIGERQFAFMKDRLGIGFCSGNGSLLRRLDLNCARQARKKDRECSKGTINGIEIFARCLTPVRVSAVVSANGGYNSRTAAER